MVATVDSGGNHVWVGVAFTRHFNSGGSHNLLPPTRMQSEPASRASLQREGSFGRSLRNISRQQSLVSAEDDSLGTGGSALPFEAVIHFTNSDAVLNLVSPWKVMSPKTCTGTGFAIGDKKILTNCHVVAAATSLRVFKHGVPGNYLC